MFVNCKRIFGGPQIRKLINSDVFAEQMSSIEINAWHSLVAICKNFHGNERGPDYVEIVNELIKSYQKIK